jgi:hypothetical protein
MGSAARLLVGLDFYENYLLFVLVKIYSLTSFINFWIESLINSISQYFCHYNET